VIPVRRTTRSARWIKLRLCRQLTLWWIRIVYRQSRRPMYPGQALVTGIVPLVDGSAAGPVTGPVIGLGGLVGAGALTGVGAVVGVGLPSSTTTAAVLQAYKGLICVGDASPSAQAVSVTTPGLCTIAGKMSITAVPGGTRSYSHAPPSALGPWFASGVGAGR